MKERIEFRTFTKMSENSTIDYKELIKEVTNIGQKAIAITDHNSVEIFPKIYKYIKDNNINNCHIIYGAIVDVIINDFAIPVTIIVRKQKGLKNLYKIISQIKSYNVGNKERKGVKKQDLGKLCDGLLYGLDTNRMMEIYENQTDKQVAEDMMWYDFIMVSPANGLSWQNDIKRIIKIAKNSQKIVIATGNVHYLHKEEQNDYKMMFPKARDIENKYLYSTQEMLNQWQFLNDADLIEDIVIKKPNMLADLIEDIEISSDKLYLPKINNDNKIFLKIINEKVEELYGNNIPSFVEKRINEELYGKNGNKFGIINKGYETVFLIYKELVEYSHKLGYPVLARGKIASSFIAYLLGITDVNPLPSHYRCPKCKEVYWENNYFYCALDMPNKECLKCHCQMSKEGFNIPYETFLGYDDRVLDIDLNFALPIQKEIHTYLQKLWGKKYVFKAGVIALNSKVHEKEIEIKKSIGIHPGGFMLIPKDKEIYDFTPVNYFNNDKNNLWKRTHFDYHDINRNIIKFDLLGLYDLNIIKKLEDLTKIKASAIPLDDKKTIEYLKKGETVGLLAFDNDIVRKIMLKIKPSNFGDLIKIIGLAKQDSEEDIIKKIDNYSWPNIITNRDDIMNYLVKYNFNLQEAFLIMEFIGKGNIKKAHDKWKIFKQKMEDAQINSNFIENCEQIKYLFPKAHLVSYCIKSFQIAWYKVHYPRVFKKVIKDI